MPEKIPFLKIAPMMATTSDPFDSCHFIYEVKWDGYRCVAYLNDRTVLQSRNLIDISCKFPELADLHLFVEAKPAILDGEIIIPGEGGKPSFSLLQERGRTSHPGKVRQAAAKMPAVYVCFDIMYHQGRNIMKLPLIKRKKTLREAVSERDNLVVCQFIHSNGISYYKACAEMGLEGVMAKQHNSPYLPGKRSAYWRKFRNTLREDFIIIGYELGTGGRLLGALILGACRDGQIICHGKVGAGFGCEEQKKLIGLLIKLRPVTFRSKAQISGLSRPQWVEPKLVCEVEFLGKTSDGRLRHPVYKGLRTDKHPEECAGVGGGTVVEKLGN